MPRRCHRSRNRGLMPGSLLISRHRTPVCRQMNPALRAAVVRILREELAGELGEKITRNVRKLVRREINRALASHDLD